MAKIDYQDIDPVMRDIIKLLNKKGYKTIGYCSGHPTDWKLFNKKYKELKKQGRIKNRTQFSISDEGYLFFEREKDSIRIFKYLKGTKMYPKLKLYKGSSQFEFNSHGLNKRTINARWKEVYEVLKNKLTIQK